MELSEFKQVINDIPAIYDTYEVCANPNEDGFFIGDYTVDDMQRTITLEGYDEG
jgi:hypothetical protein